MKAKGKTKGVFYRNGIAYIRYIDAEGKERKESTRQGSTTAAKRLLEKRKTEVMMCKHFPAKQMVNVRFGNLLDYWWDRHGQFTRSGFNYLMPRIRKKFGKKKAREMHADNIEEFLLELKDQGLSASSINHHRTIMNSVFNFTIKRQRYFGDNPVSAVAQMKEPPGRDRVPTTEEFRRILQFSRQNDFELYVFLVLDITTSARKSELLERRWDEAHLDGQSPFLKVPETKNGDPKKLILAEVAVEALKQLPSYGKSEYLFPSRPTGRFPEPKSPHMWDIGGRFRKVRRTLGIKGLRIHDLRHAGPSILMEHGIPDGVVRILTGHRSKELERYQHLSEQTKQQTVDIISREFVEQIPEHPKNSTGGAIIYQMYPKGNKGLEWRGRRDSNSRPPA